MAGRDPAGPTDSEPMTASATDPQGSCDLLVIGSGVAGLSAALAAAHAGMQVAVATKGRLSDGTTRWAQGGVAAVLGGADDSLDDHVEDTLAAGGGLCDPDAVRVLVDQGPRGVGMLMGHGAVFDRDPDGTLSLALEGGHRAPRVIHAGGSATGAEIERALDTATARAPVRVHEHWFATDLIVRDGRCVGVQGLDATGAAVRLRAAHVLLASGGAGQLFSVTTNPRESTGDGAAMALRAGVAVADVEFMQFHPTALHVPAMPRPLLTEALRGHGAFLRDPTGARFVDELQPRDVVSRAETAVMAEHGVDHVFLDATGLEGFATRFPNIAAALAKVGLDPSRDWLPVAPAAHYLCGGVVTDLSGASSLPGLWAAGEASCTGVHGANRLASNSLLEGLVYGPRVVEAILAGQDGPRPRGAMRTVLGAVEGSGDDGGIGGRFLSGVDLPSGVGATPGFSASVAARSLEALQTAMTTQAGVLRSDDGLARAGRTVATVAKRIGTPVDRSGWELWNLCTLGGALVAAARERSESRGAHTRVDVDTVQDPAFRFRFVQGLDPG